MRVSLQGPGLTQLAPLCAAFWGHGSVKVAPLMQRLGY